MLAAQSDRTLIVACDMPFLNADLLNYMFAMGAEYDVVIPSAPDPSKPREWKGANRSAKDNDLHPLHAMYGKACLEPISRRIESGDLRAISFYPDVRVRVDNHETWIGHGLDLERRCYRLITRTTPTTGAGGHRL